MLYNHLTKVAWQHSLAKKIQIQDDVLHQNFVCSTLFFLRLTTLSRGENMEIGRKIKQIRLQRDLTQEELASRTELTKGYISQLENDLSSPSIATLEDILNVLGVTLQDFFAEPKEEKVVFTANDYFVSSNGTATNTWLIPNSQKNDMEPIILTLPVDGVAETRLPFEGEEFGYVLEGKILIVTPTEVYKLKKGESFSINGKKEHTIKNNNNGRSRVLWVTTPSNF